MSRGDKELSQVVHQLRLLLVEKEEEIETLRKELKFKRGAGPSKEDAAPSAELLGELEEQKDAVASLTKSLEKMREESEEKLRRLGKELEEKERTIASLRTSAEDAPPSPASDERLDRALHEIERLEEELSQARAALEDAGRSDEPEEAAAHEELGDRLSSMEKEIERRDRSLRKLREDSRRSGRQSAWLAAACAALGAALCVALVANIAGRRGAPVAEGQMDFITAAEEDLLREEQMVSAKGVNRAALGAEDLGVGGAPAGGRLEYVVRPGDSLWKICKRELGDPSLADRVARENNLQNARDLKVGTVLYLPGTGAAGRGEARPSVPLE